MALADVQSLWTDKMKPHVSQTYATKTELGQKLDGVTQEQFNGIFT